MRSGEEIEGDLFLSEAAGLTRFANIKINAYHSVPVALYIMDNPACFSPITHAVLST